MDRLRPGANYAHLNSYGPEPIPDYVQLSNFTLDSTSKLQDETLVEYHSTYDLRAGPVQEASSVLFWKTWRFSGWRFGAFMGAVLAALSLVINLTAIAWLSSHNDRVTGLVEIFRGDCNKTKAMNTWVHLAINVISTLLLGGSNYSMQCLVAPTRSEIDKEHSHGKFLDIGVPSIRNLAKVSTYKMVLWWLLGLSSVPLHLFYNSAFYSSIAALDYDIFVASPEFVTGSSFNLTAVSSAWAPPMDPAAAQKELTTYDNLTNSECIREYAQIISTERRTLVIVSRQNATSNNSLLKADYYRFNESVDPNRAGYRPFDWICSDPNLVNKVSLPAPWNRPDVVWPTCDVYVSQVQAKASEWAPYGFQADYCLSQRATQKCSFNGNIPIIAAVIVCNAIKAIVMILVAFKLTDRPLITIGDAIESFLQKPDPTTKGLCWLTRDEVHDYTIYAQHFPDAPFPAHKSPFPLIGKEITAQKRRWSSAAGLTRWTITLILFAVCLATVGGLLYPALNSIHKMGKYAIIDMGFGQLQPVSVISGWAITYITSPATQILCSVLVANSPQVILSFLYLNLNGLITTMWLSSEWNDFATQRKHLRVSSPEGQQRSTHFLQLPYRVAIPLMIMSGLIHWSISQSIFLAVVSEYDHNGHIYNPVEIASCGYSVMAIIVTMCLTFCLVLATVALGCRKYDCRIPLVGSCSAAISAACHRPKWDSDAALQPVQYGVLTENNLTQDPDVGHCCFTSAEVTFVEEGNMYAGIVERGDDDNNNGYAS